MKVVTYAKRESAIEYLTGPDAKLGLCVKFWASTSDLVKSFHLMDTIDVVLINHKFMISGVRFPQGVELVILDEDQLGEAEIQQIKARLPRAADCTFLYFKPGGKWKYDGRGLFPRPKDDGWHDVCRAEIMRENGGMPGLADGYDAKDLTIIVIPDEGCDVPTAFPRMIKAVEVS